MIAATTPNCPLVLRQPPPQSRNPSDRPRMRANTHHTQAIARIRSCLSIFKEEIHATSRPIHAARTTRQCPPTPNLAFEAVEQRIEANGVLKSIHDAILTPVPSAR